MGIFGAMMEVEEAVHIQGKEDQGKALQHLGHQGVREKRKNQQNTLKRSRKNVGEKQECGTICI